MKIYIDKENVLSLFSHNMDMRYFSCINILKKVSEVKFNFPKTEILGNNDLSIFFRSFTRGVESNCQYADDGNVMPNRPLKPGFYCDKRKSLTSVYLLNDAICDTIKKEHKVLIGKEGEELEILSNLIFEDDEKMAKDVNWQEDCPQLPFSDIIICDNYLFADELKFSQELDVLLKAMLMKHKGNDVNIVIFVLTDKIVKPQEKVERIRNLSDKIIGEGKTKVTIICSYSLHDRCIITNYFRIKHGQGFAETNLKSNVTVDFKSHMNKSSEKVTKEELEILRNILKQKPPCYGDRICNFLDFQQ